MPLFLYDGSEKMKKVFFTILAFILGIALGIGIIYIVDNNSKNNEKKESKNEEIEITDNLLKEDLTKKIYAMSSIYGSDNTDFSENLFKIHFTGFRDSLYNDLTLTDDQKLEIALDHTIQSYDYTAIPKDDLDLIMGVKKKTDVEKMYLKYFGTKEFTHKRTTSCSGDYSYDEANQVYYVYEPACGGSGPLSYYLYMNKMTTKGNKAYVYLNAFAIEGDVDENNDITYNVYKDVSKTKVYQKNITEEESNSFKVDSTNAHNFDQYKFTFEKDTKGNYYFKSISKVN